MNLPSSSLKFWRRVEIWLACIIGLGTATASWWFLPPAPRFSLKLASGQFVAFSPDFRYLALSGDEKLTAGGFTYTRTIWDLAFENRLCSFEFDPVEAPDGDLYWGKDIAWAFSEDGRRFLQFCRGKAQFRDSLTGERVEVDLPAEFPFGAKRTSRLIQDARGRNYVLIKDENNLARIRDLLTGKQTASFPVPSKSEFLTNLPGILSIISDDAVEVRKIPNGEYWYSGPGGFGTADGNISAIVTPVRVNTAGKVKVNIRDFRTGVHRVVPMVMSGISALVISPDGRYLATVETPQHDAPRWLEWLWDWVGFDARKEQVVVLYDLSTGLEAASFGDRNWPIFSLDGNSVAIGSGGRLEVYDLPLPRPWRRIVGYGALSAVITWLLLWWRKRRRSRFKGLSQN